MPIQVTQLELLSFTAKFYVLGLLMSAVYIVFSLTRMVVRLRRLPTDASNAPHLRSLLNEMVQSAENLRQFNILLFFLFGISFFTEMSATIRTIRFFAISLSEARINIFEPLVAFAISVFIVLALLHTLQWTVAARVQSKLNSITR
jgi:hypothetical protein